MRIRTLSYFFREATTNLKRNSSMSLASVGTVAVSLTILGALFLVLFNLGHITGDVASKVEMRVFIRDEVSADQESELKEKINNIAGVSRVSFIGKDKALKRLKSQLGENGDLVKIIGDNPLPDSFQVRVRHTGELKAIADVITTYPGVEEVNYGEDFVDKLLTLTRLLWGFTILSSIAMGIAVLFLIVNTIRITLFNRRREIEIMKLVGATDWFIRWPFLIEGLMIGIFGSLVAILTCTGVYEFTMGKLYSSAPFLPLAAGSKVVFDLCIVLIVLGALVGSVGSVISIRKFLHV